MVIFLDVYLEIIVINEVLNEYFNDNIYDLFLNGYCLEYFNILKSLHKEAKLVLEKNNEHCAALINNKIYDVSGIRSKDDFEQVNTNKEEFVNSFYKRFSDEIRSDLQNKIENKLKLIKS